MVVVIFGCIIHHGLIISIEFQIACRSGAWDRGHKRVVINGITWIFQDAASLIKTQEWRGNREDTKSE